MQKTNVVQVSSQKTVKALNAKPIVQNTGSTSVTMQQRIIFSMDSS